MFQNGRKTIGVFISDLWEEYQDQVTRGIEDRAGELGYNVVFFTGFGAYEQECYGRGELNVIQLADLSRLDGIIFAPGTYAIDGGIDMVLKRIHEEAKCPVVTVNDDLQEFGCVQIDNQHVLEEMIEHFVVKHHFTRIDFLSGPKGNPVADARLDSYRRIMEKYGIWDERRVFYGDFWQRMAADAVDYFLSIEPEPPQAIICANDSMAITSCLALAGHGLRVPEDVAVSGCDNIQVTSNFTPTLTTVSVSNYSMGVEAVNKLKRLCLGIGGPRISYCSSETVYRESCGCKQQNKEELTKSRHRLFRQMQDNLRQDQDNMFLSVELQDASDLEQLSNKLESYSRVTQTQNDIYLCLSDDWRERGKQEESFGFSDRMWMSFGIRDGVRIPAEFFPREELLPKSLLTEKPMVSYLISIHYRARCFGYVAVTGELCKSKNNQLYIINICNALENLRVRDELKQVVDELNDMYIQDVLTGLNNRRGFQQGAAELFDRAVKEKKNLFSFGADVDDLKGINDTYGHSEGDHAIRLVADALAAAAEEGEICARVGGDEFSVLGIGYTEEKAKEYEQRFIQHMERLNRENPREYSVYASWGMKVVAAGEYQLEELLNAADQEMYDRKNLRKKTGAR